MINMINLTPELFVDKVLDSDKPVVVDFWSPFCNPCLMLSPELESVSDDFKGKVNFYKLNTQEYPEISNQYGVVSVPTLVIFLRGKIIGRFSGYADRNLLKKIIQNSLRDV